MTDLVTDAAIEACQRGQGCEESDGCICAEWITDGLKAAAPLIAAEALRQAARLVEPGSVRPAGAPSTLHYSDLLRIADELERG